MRDIEHGIQEACVRWFNLQYPSLRGLLFAVPNGGARDVATGRRMKEEGVVAGVADLILMVPKFSREVINTHYALCIEMKSQKGRQSPAQKEWQELVEARGYKYTVCRSLDEFMATIKNYLNNGIVSTTH